jgi:hypothetical protein
MMKNGKVVPITKLRDFVQFKKGDPNLINRVVTKTASRTARRTARKTANPDIS